MIAVNTIFDNSFLPQSQGRRNSTGICTATPQSAAPRMPKYSVKIMMPEIIKIMLTNADKLKYFIRFSR